MSVIDEYLASLDGRERAVLEHMYGVVREMVPSTTEELSYNMPAFKCNGKGLIAIIANKNFLSVYPFCGISRLELELSTFEQTTGSVHFTLEHPMSDDTLREIVRAKLQLIVK